jgi:hypothetical protein
MKKMKKEVKHLRLLYHGIDEAIFTMASQNFEEVLIAASSHGCDWSANVHVDAIKEMFYLREVSGERLAMHLGQVTVVAPKLGCFDIWEGRFEIGQAGVTKSVVQDERILDNHIRLVFHEVNGKNVLNGLPRAESVSTFNTFEVLTVIGGDQGISFPDIVS